MKGEASQQRPGSPGPRRIDPEEARRKGLCYKCRRAGHQAKDYTWKLLPAGSPRRTPSSSPNKNPEC